MTATLFLAFVALTAAAVVALSARYLNGRTAFTVTGGLFVWLLYVGLLGYFGVIRNTTMRPPGIAFIFVPVVLFLVLFIVRVRSSAGAGVALAFPLWIILGTQSFRIIVELFLHQLWIDGLLPKMLTFAGANVDIYVGASAPLIAWLSTRGRLGLRLALAWNALGLLALANVVTRAVLTTPGPFNLIHAEVPNLMFGTFPYMFIPGFFVPLAVVLHVLAIRAISSRLHTAISGANVARVTDKTIVIPRYGPVGKKSQLVEFRDMLVSIRNKVSMLKKAGRSVDEAVAAKPTADYDAKWGGYVIDGKTFTTLVYAGV